MFYTRRVLRWIWDKWHGRPTYCDIVERGRSSDWEKVRNDFLLKYPTCAWCNGKACLEVHHIKPFHLYPALELEPRNLITLCDCAGKRCHRRHGHGGNWKKFTVTVIVDCQRHNHKYHRDKLLE